MLADKRRRVMNFQRLLCVLCLTLLLPTGALAEPKWTDRTYSLYLKQDVLSDVIRDLISRERIPVKVDDNIDERVSARFQNVRAQEVFDTLSAAYGLQWHFDGQVMHVSQIDNNQTRTITLRSVPPTVMKQKLTELAVLDARFFWSGVDDTGLIVVSGPVTYVDRVEELAKSIDRRGGGHDNVYRWVDEQGITNISSRPGGQDANAEVIRVRRPGAVRAADPALIGSALR